MVCTGINADINSLTGYAITSYFRSAFIEVRKTAENAVSDGFGSNFSGTVFCFVLSAHQLVGILLNFDNSQPEERAYIVALYIPDVLAVD